MQATHTACAIAILAGLLAAQGGGRSGSSIRTLAPCYPHDRATARFVPFQDAQGRELKVTPLASGCADFDGDKNVDLWFLGHGAQQGEIAVQFGNTASLGRFYRNTPIATSKFTTAATYRTKTTTGSQLLVVDPAFEDPMLLAWNPKSKKSDPRDGSLGGALTGWKIGFQVTEIATADHAKDGHDDILALQALPGNQTAVHKLVMGTQKHSFLWVEQKLTAVIPARLENLRALDVDGDGRTDFVANAPGVGVIVCRDTGNGGFETSEFWPTYTLPVKDLDVGDFNGSGREDIAVCFAEGIVVLQRQATGGNSSYPWHARFFLNPPTIRNLHNCRIVDSDGKGTMLLFGFPKDGRSYVIHPHNPGAFGIVKPWIEWAPTYMTGKNPSGQGVLVADVDNDGDRDLVMQGNDGVDWMTLRNPSTSFAPTAVRDVDKGPAPTTEGPKSRRLNVTIDVPQTVVDANILFVEIGMWVIDPDSQNKSDPDWIYWGRLMPAIDTSNNNASFTVFYNKDEAAWQKRVKDYKQKRAANINTFFDVYPKNEWETIRGGPGLFMSMHAVDLTKRFESANGNEPPNPNGSTLGAKWVLVARPPSPKGDLELLPFE